MASLRSSPGGRFIEMRSIGFFITVATLLSCLGCQSDSEVSPAEDKVLRGKIDQGLSPAEIEKHFGKDYMKNNSGGAAAPAPAKSGG